MTYHIWQIRYRDGTQATMNTPLPFTLAEIGPHIAAHQSLFNVVAVRPLGAVDWISVGNVNNG